MKRLVLILLILFSVNVFADYYKVYFKNGGVLMLKNKPDFSKEKVYGITFEGKKVVFSKKYVDMEKTLKANKPKPKKEVKKKKVKKTNMKSNPFVSSKNKKPPLIITEATIGKKNKDKKKKAVKAGKKKTNPFMEWMDDDDGSLAEPAEEDGISTFANEEEAKKYWRSKFIAVNNSIKETENSIKKIQSELNRLFSEKLNTDDTFYIMKVNKKMEQLEKKKKALEKKLLQLKKKKNKLKDEARKAGALPGWYRDLI